MGPRGMTKHVQVNDNKKNESKQTLVLMLVMAASFWIYKQIPISLFHPAHHLHCTNCKQTLDHLHFLEEFK